MIKSKAAKENVILIIILACLLAILVGMSYAFLKTSFFGNKTNVLKVGSLSLTLDETSGNAITVEDGAPMYDSEGVKQDNYFTFSLKNGGKIDTSYTIYLEDQPLDDGDVRVGQSYVHYNLEKDNSVLPAKALEGDQAIDKGIIKSNQTINYKMRLWFSSDIPQSEENKVFKAKLNIVGNQNTKMMASGGFGLTNDEKVTITKVVFQDSIKSIDNESKVWDMSSSKNKTVMARMVPNTDDSSTNTLYIQEKGGVTANSDSSNLFNGFSKLLEIENLKLLDTLTVTNMSQMFSGCSSLTSLDVSNFDTSQVTSMKSMFYGFSNLTNLYLNNFNMSNVTNLRVMFANCNNLINLDLRKASFDKVETFDSMFSAVPGLINIITKDETTKSWLEDKLGGKGTVTIA